jgi:iron-sulfur cluster assembly protein
MLGVTEEAARTIRVLVGDQPGAGLRMYTQESTSDASGIHVGLSVETGPQPSDEVIEQMGCVVFVDPQLASAIDGRTLDAQSEGQQVRFVLVS